MNRKDKAAIIFATIIFVLFVCLLFYFANSNSNKESETPLDETETLEFSFERADLSLTFTTRHFPGGKEWITAESGKVFVIVNFRVKNNHKKKAQKITKPFVLKVAESDLTFEDRCPWAERSLAEREVRPGETIFDDVCFEVPEKLAESEFLIEHNGQQWQIPPMAWGG